MKYLDNWRKAMHVRPVREPPLDMPRMIVPPRALLVLRDQQTKAGAATAQNRQPTRFDLAMHMGLGSYWESWIRVMVLNGSVPTISLPFEQYMETQGGIIRHLADPYLRALMLWLWELPRHCRVQQVKWIHQAWCRHCGSAWSADDPMLVLAQEASLMADPVFRSPVRDDRVFALTTLLFMTLGPAVFFEYTHPYDESRTIERAIRRRARRR